MSYQQPEQLSPHMYHEYLLKNQKKQLAYTDDVDFEQWRGQVREKLAELLGHTPERVPANVRIEWEKEHETFTETRFVFDSAPMTSVPCHLLVPKAVKKPCPVVICLQGHSSGMHISLARAKFENDEKLIAGGDRDFALQAVRQGYAALVMEQRGFGERRSEKKFRRAPDGATTCDVPSSVALLLGRTMIGERVWDICRLIDVISEFPQLDPERIGCMGNSGGGTATYYAACMDERIKIAMPSCSVCSLDQSIGIMRHCICNFIPRMAEYFDMGDLSCLIAPRKLVVVAGEKDVGFLLPGTLDAFGVIQKVYDKADYPENCRLVLGPEGHRFYGDLSWPVFRELSGW